MIRRDERWDEGKVEVRCGRPCLSRWPQSFAPSYSLGWKAWASSPIQVEVALGNDERRALLLGILQYL